jgi:hypothetical protein
MNDKKLKDMWNNITDLPDYGSASIEQFISKRSSSISGKLLNALRVDIFIKTLVGLSLVINLILYQSTPAVLLICSAALVILIFLIYFETKTLKDFNLAIDTGKSARDNLSSMLTFFRSRYSTAMYAMASTGLFFFTSGMLLYFYAVYGQVRPLDSMDYFVFGIFYLIIIISGFVITSTQVRYHIKHLEVCLSDLNENSLAMVAERIEEKRKQDRLIKGLMVLLIIFGFTLLMIVLKHLTG